MIFRVLVADPPWRFGDALPGKKRGASSHYKTLTFKQIARFPLPPLADDCYLFLWRVGAMQWEALHVVQHWGFTPTAEIVWNKMTRLWKPHFGMGRHVRWSHESCILATRGKPKPKSRSVRSSFSAPVGRHSEKPGVFYELVEKLAHGPYVELFARRQRLGWTCYGDELKEAHP